MLNKNNPATPDVFRFYGKNPISIIFDLVMVTSLFLYLTGGYPWIDGELRSLIERKPSIHRIFLMTITAIPLFWYLIRYKKFNRPDVSPLTRGLAIIPLSPLGWTWLIFISSSLMWACSSILRHESLSSGFDMAIFVQSVSNCMGPGSCLHSSIKSGINILGDHFSPVLLSYAAIYRLYSDPKCLLILQAVFAAASVFPLYQIALKKTLKPAMGIAFAIAFMFYLPVRNAVRFEFHPEIIAMPLFLWAFYYLESKKYLLASFFLLMCLAAKENAALVVFAFGFYACFIKRERLPGLFWMLSSCLYFYLAVHVFVPYFSGQPYAYLSGNFLAWKNEGIKNFLVHLVSMKTMAYLLKIFLPLGLLSFLAPAQLILALPLLAQNLLARNEAVLSIFFQYTIFLTPFIFISAIYGAARLRSRWTIPYILSFSLLMSGVSEFYIMTYYGSQITPRTGLIKEVLRGIPSDKSLRTHEFFAAHAAQRMGLHIYENNHPREGGSPAALAADYVVLDEDRLSNEIKSHFEMLESLGYRRLFEKERIHVFTR